MEDSFDLEVGADAGLYCDDVSLTLARRSDDGGLAAEKRADDPAATCILDGSDATPSGLLKPSKQVFGPNLPLDVDPTRTSIPRSLVHTNLRYWLGISCLRRDFLSSHRMRRHAYTVISKIKLSPKKKYLK